MNDAGVPDLVDRLYEAAFDADAWPSLLTEVAEAVGGVGALLLPVSALRDVKLIYSPNLAESCRAYEEGWWQYDIRTQVARRRGLRGICTDRDILTETEMGRNPFYQDFLRPHGLGHFMAHISVPAPAQANSLSIQRDLRKGAFEQAEADRLRTIGPHVSRALTLAIKAGRLSADREALTTVVDRMAAGILVLDATGRVTFMNPAAERLLVRDRGLCVRHRHLRCTNAGTQRDLDALVASALPGADRCPDAPVLVTLPDGRQPLLVQALPLRSRTADRLDQAMVGTGGAVLLVHDLTPGEADSCVDQLRHMGLTLGQARAADMAGHGLGARQTAERLGIKEDSVRQVLKAVFAKLGLARQSQLAALTERLRSVRVDAEPGENRH